MATSPYAGQIWSYLVEVIGNEFGVAGLMGNLQAESGLLPYRLQGDFTVDYVKSTEYTKKVNSGKISKDEFIGDKKGYGLAQWTFSSRKKGLYELKIERKVSISALSMQLDYLMWELENSFPSVLNTLRNATSIREASNAVLHDFENPKDQSESVEILREALGIVIYNEFSGSEPVPIDPDDPIRNPLKYLKVYMMTKRLY